MYPILFASENRQKTEQRHSERPPLRFIFGCFFIIYLHTGIAYRHIERLILNCSEIWRCVYSIKSVRILFFLGLRFITSK